ncbi:hypothetical protein [Burkholderia sp. JKS000303]|uniref:hypothetical protein n=1 Tax=Burkholderia sp. JKS000303 TaxID=1938747 RepID=UPI0015CF03D7|nr:hypothetical protein [Burkholderia sp. JKS000303]
MKRKSRDVDEAPKNQGATDEGMRGEAGHRMGTNGPMRNRHAGWRGEAGRDAAA